MATCGSGSTLGKEEDLAIISGVLDGVKQSFVDEGVDPVILEQLQQLWVSKLTRIGGPGLGVRDVLIPQIPQTQENDLQPEVGEEADAEVISPALSVPAPSSSSGARPKTKKLRKKVKKLIQVDGPADSSDEEDGLDDDDDGDDDDDDDDDDLDPDA